MITLFLAGVCAFAVGRYVWMYRISWQRRPGTLASVSGAKPRESQWQISVLVPVWNDATVLDRCLDSIAREIRDRWREAELIIIAGGTDGSYERAHDWKARQSGIFRVTVLEQSAQGKNHALNDGVACAQGCILVLVDADTRVSPGWLPALIEPIIRGQAVASTGRFYPFAQTPVSNIFVIEQYLAQVVSGAGNLFGGGTIALSTDTWHQIGGFADAVIVGVDWDLTQKLHRLGLVTCFVHSAEVVTEIAESWREFWRGEVRWRRGWWVLQRSFSARLMAIYAVVAGASLWCSLAALIGCALFPAAVRNPVGMAAWAVLIWCLGHYVTRLIIYARHSRAALTPTEVTAYLLAAYVSALALMVGLCTRRKLSPHFKGQRRSEAA